MARKTIYSKESIINAAEELIEKYGKGSYSVRNVARYLNASTQPIYSFFKDSEELYQAVLVQVKSRLIAHTKIEYTDYLFRNIGLGFTYFARDYPNLFTAFFDDTALNKTFTEAFLKDLRTALDSDSRFLKMSSEGKDVLLDKMWIFSYGYARLIIQGIVVETSDEAIQKMIVDVGMAIIKDALHQENLFGPA